MKTDRDKTDRKTDRNVIMRKLIAISEARKEDWDDNNMLLYQPVPCEILKAVRVLYQ